MKLRDYQTKTLNGIRREFKTGNSTLVVLATGMGKTVVVGHLCKEFMERGRVLMLAHRAELVGQAHRTLYKITGVEPETEMAQYGASTWGMYQSSLIVGSIQTQVARRGENYRMEKFDPKDFSLLIIDEAHHAAAQSYRQVIDYYRQNPDLKVVGLTATPDRADELALGQIFESVAAEYDIRDGIDDGWLVDVKQRSVYVEDLDYSEVRTTAGDLNGADLSKVLEYENVLHGFCDPIVKELGDKKTLVFAASVAQAERMCEILNRHKPESAEWVSAKTNKDDRRELWPRYARGEFQYCVNVGITTEGWDEPTVEAIAMCRPTKSRSLYAQMLGRGTRTLAGIVDDCSGPEARKLAIAASAKPHLEVLDFVGNAGRHKLITPADILGGRYDDEIVERARENAEKLSDEQEKSVDVIEQLEIAEQQIIKEKREAEERQRRRTVTLRARYKTQKVDPFGTLGIQPWRTRAWDKGRLPSDKQILFLERNGISAEGLNFAEAHQLVGKLIQRRKQNLATFKQTALLQRFGYETDTLTRPEATELITELKNNGWRRPA